MKAIKVGGNNVDKEVIITTQKEDTKQSISKNRTISISNAIWFIIPQFLSLFPLLLPLLLLCPRKLWPCWAIVTQHIGSIVWFILQSARSALSVWQSTTKMHEHPEELFAFFHLLFKYFISLMIMAFKYHNYSRVFKEHQIQHPKWATSPCPFSHH